ncbi:MAG TPA: DUF5700 domain-containing putative Zn-dependent protease, partial [Cyclobacteriaceae bacterium]|nr:DUF5700 domain-containing putative Zn-dependent protease [Cyclobacteriaceae bacterium]
LEGFADMIDKEKFLATKGKGFPKQLFETYDEHYASPSKNFKKVDSMLVVLSGRPEVAKQSGKAINELLPLAGHPHGYFMAKTIAAVHGKNELMKTIYNPFAFFKAYNVAAKKHKDAYVFSKEAMAYLDRLEVTYFEK